MGEGRFERTQLPPVAVPDLDRPTAGHYHDEEKKETPRRTRVDDAVDCPVEVPAWLMGLCGFLGDLPCWMPRGAVIGGKCAGCDWAPCFSHRLNEM